MREFIGPIIVATIFCFVLLFVGVTLSGCSPRSSLYCIQHMDWVTCPNGVQPGTDLDKVRK